MQLIEHRPWGTYTVLLDATDCKVKSITIKPGESPSYQYHFKRREHWIIVQGSGTLILNDVHRDVNTGIGDLKFIEVQTGEYFGEDDIVRLEDKYGRK